MFNELEERIDKARTSVENRFTDEPDGRNDGVGKTENLLAFGAAIAATFLARNALQATWRTTLDREPPKNPASPDVDWKDALLWGGISGAVVGMVRIASRRGSSAAYNRFRS